MNIARVVKHLFTTQWKVHRLFPQPAITAIEEAIKASESSHIGEIRFVVEGALDGSPLFNGQSTKERALDVFSHLRIWDTQHNNGLLIYLLLADRHVEIIADRGLHDRVGCHEWDKICREMETAFKQKKYEAGVLSGIRAVTKHLINHFPAVGASQNELPDKPVLL